jgi:hypothetical protein
VPSLDDILQGLGLEPGPPQVAAPPDRRLYAPPHEADDPANSQSFSVFNGVDLDAPLGFVAGSVAVDNNTSAYMNILDASKDGTGRWVPPGQGAAMPLLGHISRARIKWTAPPGRAQSAPIATEKAQVTFFASPIPLGFGISSPAAISRQNAFPSLSRAPATYNFDVPAQMAAKGVMVYINYIGGAGGLVVSVVATDGSGNESGAFLSSVRIAATAVTITVLRIYPGLAVTANFTASDLIGQTPRIKCVVDTANVQFKVDYDLLA